MQRKLFFELSLWSTSPEKFPITWGLFSFRFTCYKMYILPNWKALQTILQTLVLSLWSFLPLKPLVFPLFLSTKSGKQNINVNFSTYNIHFQTYFSCVAYQASLVKPRFMFWQDIVQSEYSLLINKICCNQVFPQLQLAKWPQYPNHIRLVTWYCRISGSTHSFWLADCMIGYSKWQRSRKSI